MPEKIRIGLVLQGGDAWRGGLEYFANLIRALRPFEERGEVEVSWFAHDADRAAFSEAVPRFAEGAVEPPRTAYGIPPWRRAWNRINRRSRRGRPPLQRRARDLGIDFLYPYFHPYEPAAGETRALATAAWIPDFQHRHLPEFFPAEECRARDRVQSRAARHADCMVLSSRAAEADFRDFHPGARSRTAVLHFHTIAPAAWFEADPAPVLADFGLPARFFFCANQFWMHKDHATAFRAIHVLKRRGVDATLVCTGQLNDYRQPGYVDALRQLVVDLGIDDRIALLGLIPRSRQVQLFRQAIAVVQPSLFEGWSTVVEDCRALGKPVLLSDIPVHREQSPVGCRFFEPRSPESLADVMEAAWRDLPAGPQPADEAAARARGGAAVDAFARQFLDIAADTVRLGPPGPARGRPGSSV